VLTKIGVRRGIDYTWAFMLLGQIVAISFATNLYFLTLLLSPQRQGPATSSKDSANDDLEPVPTLGYRKWLGPWFIDGLSVWVMSIAASPPTFDRFQRSGVSDFTPGVLLPHVVLMVLPTLRASLTAKRLPLGDAKTVDQIYKFLWFWNAQSFGRLVWATYKAYQAGNIGGVRDALLEHPAVSSVGFDVIFCWLSWICWYQTDSGTKTLFTP
jgi:hypothetical protein